MRSTVAAETTLPPVPLECGTGFLLPLASSRRYGALNKRLAEREYILGDCSIADMASYPWIVPQKSHKQDIGVFPHLKRWLDGIAERPTAIKVYRGAAPSYQKPMSDAERKVLFEQMAQLQFDAIVLSKT